MSRTRTDTRRVVRDADGMPAGMPAASCKECGGLCPAEGRGLCPTALRLRPLLVGGRNRSEWTSDQEPTMNYRRARLKAETRTMAADPESATLEVFVAWAEEQMLLAAHAFGRRLWVYIA